jgi:hypothetical protein
MGRHGRRRSKEVTKIVTQHWSLNVNLAVRRLWHAAQVLGYQAQTLDPQYVALVAATYLSRTPDDVIDELEGVIGGHPE